MSALGRERQCVVVPIATILRGGEWWLRAQVACVLCHGKCRVLLSARRCFCLFTLLFQPSEISRIVPKPANLLPATDFRVPTNAKFDRVFLVAQYLAEVSCFQEAACWRALAADRQQFFSYFVGLTEGWTCHITTYIYE